MSDLLYASDDGRYRVHLPAGEMARMLACCREARGRETGGILAGYYTAAHDCAVVTEAAGPPPDSRANRTQFRRGVRGLKRWLTSLWDRSQRTYYLGEWHFHPYAAPHPSPDDCRQMRAIAASPRYHCPEPLLVIVGGDPDGEWQLSAQVFVREDVPQIPLLPVEAEEGQGAGIDLERKHDA